MNLVQILTPIVLGVALGLVLSYFAYLYRRWKTKKNLIKNIEKQEVQDFVIPKKQSDSNYKGEAVKLKDYIETPAPYDPKEDIVEPDHEYNDYAKNGRL
jgi:hypothetical protein